MTLVSGDMDEMSALEEKAQTGLEDARIVISDLAFDEFVTAINSSPEPPSEKLLATVRIYNNMNPLRQRIP